MRLHDSILHLGAICIMCTLYFPLQSSRFTSCVCYWYRPRLHYFLQNEVQRKWRGWSGRGREADCHNSTVISLNTITSSKHIHNGLIHTGHLCMHESWNEMWHRYLYDISTDNCVIAMFWVFVCKTRELFRR